MDNHMYKATSEFVTERVNYHGANEARGLQNAHENFQTAVETLRKTLSTEQSALYLNCDTAYSGLDGEQMRFYYEAGFADAIRFIIGWREGWTGH